MAIDTIAGRFALCDPVASGGSGTVWRAWDLRTHQYCAAKVLRQRDSADLIRFTREQGVRLAHPHILTPYSWVAEDAHVLIASELATGGSADTLIGDWGPLDAGTVADVLDQVLDALSHVHEVGLVHRDVKPANLLLDAGGGRLRVRLADFGIAVGTDDARLTQHGMVIGTPAYLSPEARAGAAPNPAQDLYAAGRCAAALLTGSEPDYAATHHVRTSDRLGATIAGLTAIDPAVRFASAEDARAMLQAQPDLTPRTALGEPVSVVDQLPPFPPGWSGHGPSPSRSAPTEVVPLGEFAHVTPDTMAALRSGPTPDPSQAAPAARPAQGRSAEATPVTTAAGSHRVAGRGPRRRVVLATAIPVVALVGGAGIWLTVRPSGNDTGDGSGRPTRSGVSTATTGGTTNPTGTTASPTVAGAACGWQQEGDEVATGGVTVRCTRDANATSYVWRAV